MIMVHAGAMGELRRELIETLGHDRARGALTRMGYASGSRDAVFVRRLFPAASDSEMYVMGPQLHNLEGIVNVKPCASRWIAPAVAVVESLSGKTPMKPKYIAPISGLPPDPACWMQVGYAAGYTRVVREFRVVS